MRLLSRRGGREKCKSEGVFRPQITSLIDVMTILLVFLIKNFAVDSDVVSPPPNISLPFSTSDKPALSRCAVNVTKEEIIAGDMVVARVAEVESSDSLVIEPLYARMSALLPGCMIDEAGSIVIICDKDVPFSVVKRIMASCSRAGVSNFSILVMREGE